MSVRVGLGGQVEDIEHANLLDKLRLPPRHASEKTEPTTI